MDDSSANLNSSSVMPTEEPPSFPTGQFPTSPAKTTVVATSDSTKPKKTRGKVIATIFGILLLLGGVGAGIVLVQQQQVLKQKAGAVTCSPESGIYCVPDNLTSQCTSDKKCQYLSAEHGFTKNISGCSCPSGYTDSGNYCLVDFGGNRNCPLGTQGGNTDGGIRCNDQTAAFCGGQSGGGGGGGGGYGSCGCFGSGDCVNKPNNQGVTHPANECQMGPSGTCVWNPSLCASGGGGGGGGGGGLKACGETCSSDSECYPTGANGGTERCISGICQNTACVGKTIPGRNCDCSALNACGQGCSASVGLCQPGSVCRYVVGPSCTNNPNPANPTNTYCVPIPLPAGWSTLNCVSRDQGNSYVLNASGQNPTLAQIQQACAPATPTPTPTLIPTPTPTPAPVASCNAVKAYDTNWNPMSISQLSSLAAGSSVYFTVTGNTTAGNFDMARFTINGTTTSNVTTQKPGSPQEFYYKYTIPSGVTSFSVTAQIHLQQTGLWY